MAHGDLLIRFRLEIIGQAKGGADLIVAAVAFSDASDLVIVGVEVPAKLVFQPTNRLGQLFREGEDGGGEGGDLRVVGFQPAENFLPTLERVLR